MVAQHSAQYGWKAITAANGQPPAIHPAALALDGQPTAYPPNGNAHALAPPSDSIYSRHGCVIVSAVVMVLTRMSSASGGSTSARWG